MSFEEMSNKLHILYDNYKDNPIILGNAIASIIMSEKSSTAPNFTEEPMTIKIRKINL